MAGSRGTASRACTIQASKAPLLILCRIHRHSIQQHNGHQIVTDVPWRKFCPHNLIDRESLPLISTEIKAGAESIVQESDRRKCHLIAVKIVREPEYNRDDGAAGTGGRNLWIGSETDKYLPAAGQQNRG